jgi:hypothetical protein
MSVEKSAYVSDRRIKIFINLYRTKEEAAASVGVKTHPTRIVIIVFLLIDLVPFTKPTPTTAPTIAEDVETGIPKTEKRCIPNAEEI